MRRSTLQLKNDIRYRSCPTNMVEILVDNSTPIVNESAFLSSSKTKDQLTIYVSDKDVRYCKHPIVNATQHDVKTNTTEQPPTIMVSTQEEADTLLIPHGIEVASTLGNELDLFTQDTDWLTLILRRLPQLGKNAGIVTGTSDIGNEKKRPSSTNIRSTWTRNGSRTPRLPCHHYM